MFSVQLCHIISSYYKYFEVPCVTSACTITINYVSDNVVKIEISLQVIFDEISCTIVHISLGPDFRATLKICKKSNFDRNQLKLDIQDQNMYMYQKKNIKMENSLLVIFGEIWPETMYYSTWSQARFLSNFKNL